MSFSGGEPTLYRYLEDVVHWCFEKGLSCTVTSNGFVPRRLYEIVTSLQGTQRSDPDIRFRISIDGDKEVHEGLRGPGTFEKCLASLRVVRSSMGWIGVNSITSDEFELSLDGLAQKVISLEVDDWALISETPHGIWDTASFDINAALSRLQRCTHRIRTMGFSDRIRVWNYLSYPHGGVFVDADGTVRLQGIGLLDDLVVGGIRGDRTPDQLMRMVSIRMTETKRHFFCLPEESVKEAAD